MKPSRHPTAPAGDQCGRRLAPCRHLPKGLDAQDATRGHRRRAPGLTVITTRPAVTINQPCTGSVGPGAKRWHVLAALSWLVGPVYSDPMATTGVRTRCSRCDARLRRGRPPGALCGRCERAGTDAATVLPADFYDRVPIQQALAVFDFGAVFLAVRAETGWSQDTLGEIIGLDREQISAIERGTIRSSCPGWRYRHCGHRRPPRCRRGHGGALGPGLRPAASPEHRAGTIADRPRCRGVA